MFSLLFSPLNKTHTNTHKKGGVVKFENDRLIGDKDDILDTPDSNGVGGGDGGDDNRDGWVLSTKVWHEMLLLLFFLLCFDLFCIV